MEFVDKVKIYVKAGDGGDGAVAFLREKFRPKGGPAGGDGGKGGDVIFVATKNKHTLYDLKFQKHLKAENGKSGGGKKKHGRKGRDLIVEVPVGTVVKDAQTGEVIADLTEDRQRAVIARGGKGGLGNAHFATPTRQAPRFATKGQKGEERWIILELKSIADVGLVGFPNAGKSTLINRLSNAKAEVAPYPFTTVKPNLGVVGFDDLYSFVIADIPGLIEGAHKGKGLGFEFLRHIERTKVLAFILDVGDFRDRDPKKAFEILRNELKEYSPKLLEKPQVVVLNKIDTQSDKKHLEELKRYFEKKYNLPVFLISALTGEGLRELKFALRELVEKARNSEIKKGESLNPEKS
ncbi:MAG TPA: GTPase ObgE [Aquifex aeolicus]|uniref:GTPase Obg n=1 Tax=Aquifex aeolicus TaxID=63363 RepID=A0A9D0YNB4_AQUAO|nr:GTPase ObgE [Aquificales bacterium]HIP86558.1 GTPase ObgE [Aquifex sp.]HIP97941.1 GTPase ObgE [Aquifex aeolicus]HIQ26170.1 GTPase ObgE [Aquifex aeolicus]